MKYYVGHHLQARGAEVYRLQGGKGDGMRFLYVRIYSAINGNFSEIDRLMAYGIMGVQMRAEP